MPHPIRDCLLVMPGFGAHAALQAINRCLTGGSECGGPALKNRALPLPHRFFPALPKNLPVRSQAVRQLLSRPAGSRARLPVLFQIVYSKPTLDAA